MAHLGKVNGKLHIYRKLLRIGVVVKDVMIFEKV
jgi:hypothetical protein